MQMSVLNTPIAFIGVQPLNTHRLCGLHTQSPAADAALRERGTFHQLRLVPGCGLLGGRA